MELLLEKLGNLAALDSSFFQYDFHYTQSNTRQFFHKMSLLSPDCKIVPDKVLNPHNMKHVLDIFRQDDVIGIVLRCHGRQLALVSKSPERTDDTNYIGIDTRGSAAKQYGRPEDALIDPNIENYVIGIVYTNYAMDTCFGNDKPRDPTDDAKSYEEAGRKMMNLIRWFYRYNASKETRPMWDILVIYQGQKLEKRRQREEKRICKYFGGTSAPKIKWKKDNEDIKKQFVEIFNKQQPTLFNFNNSIYKLQDNSSDNALTYQWVGNLTGYRIEYIPDPPSFIRICYNSNHTVEKIITFNNPNGRKRYIEGGQPNDLEVSISF